MKVMVTGGCGNIGRVVSGRLAGEHEVVVVDRVANPAAWSGRTEVLDLTSSKELDRLQEPFDAIVHLAAIPNPYSDPWEDVLRVNLLSTFNVLRYAAERGVPKVVYGSSESSSGWGIHRRFYKPDYLPIDEKHPSLPSEVYSYSKAIGDLFCQGFSREYDVRTVCLRYTFVLFEALYKDFIPAVNNPGPRESLGATYAWIDVQDVASAIEKALALEMAPAQTETFYLTAAKQYGTVPTMELIKRNWGDEIAVDASYYEGNEYGSFFDIRKAELMLGWKPEWDLERMIAAHG